MSQVRNKLERSGLYHLIHLVNPLKTRALDVQENSKIEILGKMNGILTMK